MHRNPPRRLVPVEELIGDWEIGAWLEDARRKLSLQSHCAMHRALADRTGLNYDAIHKALTPSTRPKRLRAEVVACLQGWLAAVDAGHGPGIPDDFRRVPVEELCTLMPRLLELLGSKQAVYRRIGRETGIRPGTVRRYFCRSGQVHTAPMTVARSARRILEQTAPPDTETEPAQMPRWREPVTSLARQTASALREWRKSGHDAEAGMHFLSLRRDLIADLHARRQAMAGG